MKKIITDYLDKIVELYPEKDVFIERKEKRVTYQDFANRAKIIATYLYKDKHLIKKPIAIFIDKSIETLESMFGVLYSGNFYTIIDTNSPKNRIDSIIDTLKPHLIISGTKDYEKIKSYNYNIEIVNLEELNTKVDINILKDINRQMISTDIAYVLFTSGSTGIPKGTVISHRSLISYIKWFKETFEIDKNTIFGNQTPFYFSMSVSDVYSTIMAGATLCIIPKTNFSFPVNLIKYLDEYKINTIYWVPSALSIVANLKTFDYILPQTLKKVLFAGEVMPMPSLNIWRKHLPDIMYANLYGPTETTDICSYYIVNRDFDNTATLPIGIPCNNCDIIIVGEDNKEVKRGDIGELYVRGDFVGNGYYNNKEKTNLAFVQNPINTSYPEIVYKTGDLGKYNEYGEIEYNGRIDFQIKHMGYRIELGEIETNMNALEGLTICAAIYDTESQKIVLFYEANKLTEEEVMAFANQKLVNYMRPNKIIKLSSMPHNANGKIDRVKLKEIYKEGVTK